MPDGLPEPAYRLGHEHGETPARRGRSDRRTVVERRAGAGDVDRNRRVCPRTLPSATAHGGDHRGACFRPGRLPVARLGVRASHGAALGVRGTAPDTPSSLSPQPQEHHASPSMQYVHGQTGLNPSGWSCGWMRRTQRVHSGSKTGGCQSLVIVVGQQVDTVVVFQRHE